MDECPRHLRKASLQSDAESQRLEVRRSPSQTTENRRVHFGGAKVSSSPSKGSIRSFGNVDVLSRNSEHMNTFGTDASKKGGSNEHLLAAVHTVFRSSTSASSKRNQADHLGRYDFIRRCLEDYRVIAFTTLLTLWVLVCDDVRLLVTEKPADLFFNIALGVCIIVFFVEMWATVLARQDYFLGFFFWLDFGSVFTLVLDLPLVQDYVKESFDGLNRASAGRTARLGSRAARMVRILRLVRIVKLYKVALTVVEERGLLGMRKRKKKSANSWGPGDNWDVQGYDAEKVARNQRESWVGQKLSEMTTRRVIVLILSMLIVMPLLETEDIKNYPASPNYGSDEVWIRFKRKLKINDALAVADYSEALLRFIYYHNWFRANAGACPEGEFCPSDNYNHLFWVGFSSSSRERVWEISKEAVLGRAAVADWVKSVDESDYIYQFGSLPSEVVDSLSDPWTQECSMNYNNQLLLGFSLLARAIPGTLTHTIRCPCDLRAIEYDSFAPRLMGTAEYDDYHFRFFYDVRLQLKEKAVFGMAVTSFVCFSLCVATMCFSSDANHIVLHPLEQIISKVEAIRDDPLSAVKMAQAEFKKEEDARLARETRRFHISGARRGSRREQFKVYMWCCFEWLKDSFQSAPEEKLMETIVLEKTVIKLGTLLAVGFGEAGAYIINHNMTTGSTADVNVMIPGQRVDCIIGNAGIQDFAVATEVLQEAVMTFVNQVAEIVHGIVDEFHGASNKNSGSTFLLIWRCGVSRRTSWAEESSFTSKKTSRLADMSIVAFSKILGALHESAMLEEYRHHPGFQQRLGANFRINLRFGLHSGWAIEGAVGSEFKIDASYISPNVAIAANVRHETGRYGVSLLASEKVVQLCEPEVRARCRLIDRAMLPGSKVPLNLYCVDLDYWSLTVEEKVGIPSWTPRQRFRVRQCLEAEKKHKSSNMFSPGGLFETDRTLMLMRQRYTEEFLEIFRMGYENYVQGEWKAARRFLSRTHRMVGKEDGPSFELLSFMQKTRYEAPQDWKGCRDLVRSQGNRSSTSSSKVEHNFQDDAGDETPLRFGRIFSNPPSEADTVELHRKVTGSRPESIFSLRSSTSREVDGGSIASLEAGLRGDSPLSTSTLGLGLALAAGARAKDTRVSPSGKAKVRLRSARSAPKKAAHSTNVEMRSQEPRGSLGKDRE